MFDFAKVFIHEWPVKILTKRGKGRQGENKLLLGCDQKRDQAKTKALQIFSQNFVVSLAQEKSI